MIQYVVFNLTSGEPVKWGQCQADLLDAQAGPGEKALETSSLSVDGNRSVIWERVKIARDRHINAGAATPFGAVDSDEEARSNVMGAALAASIAKAAAQPFSVAWTMLDNSFQTLDADQMIAVGLSVMAHVDACHNQARVLRATIDAASNMAELLAIDVEAGWPTV